MPNEADRLPYGYCHALQVGRQEAKKEIKITYRTDRRNPQRISAHFACFQHPSLPLFTPVCFLFNKSYPPFRLDTELEDNYGANNGKIKTLLEGHAYCTYFLFASNFHPLTQEDDDKMTFNCPLLSYRDHTEKDVHLQLNPLPLPVHFCPHCG